MSAPSSAAWKNSWRRKTGQFELFSCDVADFYPTIHSRSVYKFFFHDQGCSPDVARLMTRLTTYQYHVALGLVTSPILADQFLKPVDNRAAEMARRNGIVYTRYVDDITLSASFDLRKSGFSNLLKRILAQSGFRTNDAKDVFGDVGDPDVLITKLWFNRGHLVLEPA